MPTNPFVHTELSVDDVGAAQKFYAGLFGWKFQALGPEMGNYVMIDYGSKTEGGGIQPKMMPDQPSAWMPYVQVKSVSETIAKAARAGAQIVVPYQSIGGMGALGIFIDPQGAALGVWERAAARATKKAGAKRAATKKAGAKRAATKKAGAKRAAKKVAKKAGATKTGAKRAAKKKR